MEGQAEKFFATARASNGSAAAVEFAQIVTTCMRSSLV
jgi:hypothetical protein